MMGTDHRRDRLVDDESAGHVVTTPCASQKPGVIHRNQIVHWWFRRAYCAALSCQTTLAPLGTRQFWMTTLAKPFHATTIGVIPERISRLVCLLSTLVAGTHIDNRTSYWFVLSVASSRSSAYYLIRRVLGDTVLTQWLALLGSSPSSSDTVVPLCAGFVPLCFRLRG